MGDTSMRHIEDITHEGKALGDILAQHLQEAIGLVGFLHHTLCAKQRETPSD